MIERSFCVIYMWQNYLTIQSYHFLQFNTWLGSYSSQAEPKLAKLKAYAPLVAWQAAKIKLEHGSSNARA